MGGIIPGNFPKPQYLTVANCFKNRRNDYIYKMIHFSDYLITLFFVHWNSYEMQVLNLVKLIKLYLLQYIELLILCF